MTQSYTAKITRNSAWATLSFVIAAVCNFAMSVAVTRYFGKETYGQYSYFLWLSGVLAILSGFGFQQTLAKYLPKYFFGERQKTGLVFRRLFAVQIIGSLIIAALCILGVGYFEQTIQFANPQKTSLLLIVFLSVVPVSLNNFLNSSLSSIQEFKKLSGTYIATSVLNLALIVGFVLTGQNIVNFLWLYLSLSVLSSCILLAQTRHLFKKPSTPAPLGEKLFSYSLYAYVSILCTQIVWERSELFFLGMFSDSGQIALYTLSYSLAVLFISVWGPLNGVMNATTSEVVLTGKQDKLMLITQHGTKYLAMLMLPLAMLASLFIGDVVGLVYGKNFRDVSMLFPFLVLAHTVAVIITPAGSLPMLKHEMKKSMVFNLSTAAVNIVLDFYLITRYQAVGAMLANVISQGFSIMLSLINARKYRLGMFNRYMIRVFFYNMLMAGLFLGIAPLDLGIRIIAALTASAVYVFATLRTAFNAQDLRILKNLREGLPRPLQKPLEWCIGMIAKKNAGA